MRSRARRAAAVLLAASLACAAPSHAQTGAARLERARALIQTGQAGSARALLDGLLDEAQIDPIEVRFLLAMADLGAGDPASAIAILRALLVEHPELTRIRLELARALFETGDDESARFHFERLRASADLPAAVAANVERFLAALRARRGWSAGLTVAILPDSNINTGTALHSVTLYGLPGFVPSEDLRQRRGLGLYVLGSLGRAWPLSPNFGVIARGTLLRRDFPGSRFDDMILRADGGPRWNGTRDEIGVLGVASERWVANDRASSGLGARLEWLRRIDRFWHSELALEQVDYRWRFFPELDGPISQFSAVQRWNLDATTTVHAGVELHRERLASRPLANRRVSVLFGGNRDFRRGWSLGAQWRYGVTRYDEALAAFEFVERRDTTHTLSLSIAQRTLQWRGMMPVLYLTFVLNDSSLELYGYRRAIAQVGLSRNF